MRLLKIPIYKRLSGLWFYYWIKKYQANKNTVKVLVYLQTFIICFTWFFSFFILSILYLGALIYRYKIYKKIHYKIGNYFNKIFHIKRNKLFGVLLILLYILIHLFILSLIFTIPIIIVLFIGTKIEKKRILPKKIRKTKYVYSYVDNEQNKKESKTIGYLNE